MAKLTAPIPQNKIEESFVWRDWFQKLSNTVYGTLAAQDANNVNITGGTIHPSLTGVSQIIAGTNISVTPGSGTGVVTISAVINNTGPVTFTSNFTLTTPTKWVINNKLGSTCVVTLPSAANYVGSTITFQNYQPQYLVSNDSNVVPLGGGSVGTYILDRTVGNWAKIVSDGSYWVVMEQNGTVVISYLLMETGSFLLQENGSKIILG